MNREWLNPPSEQPWKEGYEKKVYIEELERGDYLFENVCVTFDVQQYSVEMIDFEYEKCSLWDYEKEEYIEIEPSLEAYREAEGYLKDKADQLYLYDNYYRV